MSWIAMLLGLGIHLRQPAPAARLAVSRKVFVSMKTWRAVRPWSPPSACAPRCRRCFSLPSSMTVWPFSFQSTSSPSKSPSISRPSIATVSGRMTTLPWTMSQAPFGVDAARGSRRSVPSASGRPADQVRPLLVGHDRDAAEGGRDRARDLDRLDRLELVVAATCLDVLGDDLVDRLRRRRNSASTTRGNTSERDSAPVRTRTHACSNLH